MVQLTPREQAYLERLERRLAYHTRQASGEDKSSVGRMNALRWLLEVIAHAMAMNCEAAFENTQLRQRKPESEQEYFRRKAQRMYADYQGSKTKETESRTENKQRAAAVRNRP